MLNIKEERNDHTEYKVIDISKYQGAVNFKKLLADGVDGVIIRCGYTGYGKSKTKNADSRWESNCKAAAAAGMPFGTYYYSCAVTPQEAKEEAEYVLNLIEGKKLSYPVYFDTEDNHDTKLYSPESQLSIGRKRLTEVAIAFLETLEKSGVCCGIYASKSWLENQLDMSALEKYDVWVAQYAQKLTYKGKHSMWQHTSKGTVNGVEGFVDMNRCYVDYPALLNKNEERVYMKKGNIGQNVLTYKMLLSVAKELGIIMQKVDDNSVFGAGTQKATEQLRQSTGLPEGIQITDELIIETKKLIVSEISTLKNKISNALEVLQ